VKKTRTNAKFSRVFPKQKGGLSEKMRGRVNVRHKKGRKPKGLAASTSNLGQVQDS
jgi:hypothetical protein